MTRDSQGRQVVEEITKTTKPDGNVEEVVRRKLGDGKVEETRRQLPRLSDGKTGRGGGGGGGSGKQHGIQRQEFGGEDDFFGGLGDMLSFGREAGGHGAGSSMFGFNDDDDDEDDLSDDQDDDDEDEDDDDNPNSSKRHRNGNGSSSSKREPSMKHSNRNDAYRSSSNKGGGSKPKIETLE
eukprot:jgi/Bigna1/146322/aug1.112_g21030